jgi:hypothetical protein
MNYQIIIPSHRRPQALLKTLCLLPRGADITIVFSDIKDFNDFNAIRPGALRVSAQVVSDSGSLREKFEFIHQMPKETKNVVIVEDDIEAFLVNVQGKLVSMRPERVGEMFEEGFKAALLSGSKIWGIAPVANHYFMECSVEPKRQKTSRLKLCIGYCWGYIEENDARMIPRTSNRADVERSLRFFVRDGSVARMDCYAVKTNPRTNQGGLQSEFTLDQRIQANKESVDYLIKNFPRLVEVNTKRDRAGGYEELTLAKIFDDRPNRLNLLKLLGSKLWD